MTLFENFWISGLMPMQLLFVLTALATAFVVINYSLKKVGKGFSMFAQSIFIWVGALMILKYVVFPPLPATLVYTYMGLITIVVFLFVSSDDKSWEEFKSPIIKTIKDDAGPYKNVRFASFIILPLFFG